MNTTATTISSIASAMMKIAEYNKDYLLGHLDMESSISLNEGLEAINDATNILNVGFFLNDKGDFGALKNSAELVNEFLLKHSIDSILDKQRNENQKKEYEEFISDKSDEILETLYDTVNWLKEINKLREKENCKWYHRETLTRLYFRVEQILIRIEMANESYLKYFNQFEEDYLAFTKTLDYENDFMRKVTYQEVSEEELTAYLNDSKQAKILTYLAPNELLVRAIAIKPEFIEQLSAPNDAIYEKLKEVAPELYATHYTEPLPF